MLRPLALFLVVLGLGAQTFNEPYTVLTGGTTKNQWTKKYAYDGSGNMTYVGFALARQGAPWQPSINNTQLTSIVDAANTSTLTFASPHGLSILNKICIYGGVVDLDLNGCYPIQTVGSTTTFTITTANVTDATYNAAGLYMTTLAPRMTETQWIILRFLYDGSNKMTDTLSSDPGQIWNNRAVTTGSTAISYN